MTRFIHHLSAELLHQVFHSLVLDEYDSRSDFDDPLPSSYPWLLSHVCRYWRDVCLNDSKLWSYIILTRHLHCHHGPQVLPDGFLAVLRVEAHLERSRNTPLFISARYHCQCIRKREQFKAIIRHSGRWEDIELDDENIPADDLELMEHSTGLANLRNVTYATRDPEFGHVFPFPEKYNQTLKSLRTATFAGIAGLQDAKSFPWQQLTSLSLERHNARLDHVLCIALAHCRTLKHFELMIDDDYIEGGVETIEDLRGDLGGDIIVVPHLATLILRDESTSYSLRILPFLRLPALRCLEIDHLGYWKDDDKFDHHPENLLVVLDLIARSSCSLIELELEQYTGTKEELVALFRATPALEYLSIQFSPEEEAEILPFFFFSRSSTGNILCPALKQLTLHVHDLKSTAVSKGVESWTNLRELTPATIQFEVVRSDPPTVGCYKIDFGQPS